MTVYDSFTTWINSFLALMGGCLGCCEVSTRAPCIDDPQKGHWWFQGQLVENTSFSEDFWWGTSTGDLENPISLSQKSFSSSLSMSNLSFQADLGSGSTNSHNEFVNHGLRFWKKNRRQWAGGTMSAKQVQGPATSLNASTCNDSLSSKEHVHPSIPLSEMVDFLVDAWEQEGLYD